MKPDEFQCYLISNKIMVEKQGACLCDGCSHFYNFAVLEIEILPGNISQCLNRKEDRLACGGYDFPKRWEAIDGLGRPEANPLKQCLGQQGPYYGPDRTDNRLNRIGNTFEIRMPMSGCALPFLTGKASDPPY